MAAVATQHSAEDRMMVRNHLQDIEDSIASASQPDPITATEEAALKEEIKALLKEKNACLIAHFYVDAALQALAEETGGCVSDSLKMAEFGASHPATTLIVAGVRFMGETAKILSMDKTVLMPEINANCSLDIGCPVDDFSAFCDKHPDRTVVVYANTSAAVKARADWVVTSSIALEICTHLKMKGEKILWAPDRYLGDFIKRKTGADMLMWGASCIVHEEFKAQELIAIKEKNPDAAVLVHPESAPSVIEQADVVGSTSALLGAVKKMPNKKFIVATDSGIFYKMKQACPEKELIVAPTAGDGATCKSCGHCPWMAMNSLKRLRDVLRGDRTDCEIKITEEVASKARVPLQRMLDFAAEQAYQVKTNA